jgi:predicted peptidase
MIRLILAAIESLQSEFSLDPSRFYLVGVSMGGNGAWEVAARFPAKFAAVVPICGAGDPASASQLTRLPIWCFHGTADPLIPVEHARKMIAAVRKAGGNPRYTEYPDVGHDSYRNAFREPDLLPWLFQQQRAPAPR